MFKKLGVSKHIDQIKISTSFPENIQQHSTLNTESYRYMKWANFIINHTGKEITLTNIDLWTITKILEEREINYLDASDILNWIKYKPFISEELEQNYLEAIQINLIEKISISNPASFIKHTKTHNEYKFLLSNWILNFSNNMNQKHKFHMHKMKNYLLPSQQFKKYWNWAGSQGPHEKKRKKIHLPPIFLLPDKKNPYFQINILDYLND